MCVLVWGAKNRFVSVRSIKDDLNREEMREEEASRVPSAGKGRREGHTVGGKTKKPHRNLCVCLHTLTNDVVGNDTHTTVRTCFPK